MFAYFSFHFSLENDDCDDNGCDGCIKCSQTAMFKISLEDFETLESLLVPGEDFYDDVTEDIESDYGVHDWSSEPGVVVGFTTYEVPLKEIPDLMTEWMNVFSSRNIKVYDLELGLSEDQYHDRIEQMPEEYKELAERLV